MKKIFTLLFFAGALCFAGFSQNAANGNEKERPAEFTGPAPAFVSSGKQVGNNEERMVFQGPQPQFISKKNITNRVEERKRIEFAGPQPQSISKESPEERK